MTLTTRVLIPERMDDPALPAGDHAAALRGLERINRLSRSAAILWSPIRRLAEKRGAGARPIRVLDVATGAGDIAMEIARRAKRSGLAMDVQGCDISPRAVDFARDRARRAGVSVSFFEWDAVRDDPPTGFDVVMCSLFLHHLSETDAVAVLSKLGQAAGSLLLVNDLRRSRAGLALAWIGTRLLSRSSVVHFDGPQSVRAAFSLDEVADLARRAGLSEFSLARRWPCRYLLEWRRK
ncbi:MAG: methyltransferase domain-containing protein [Phycisphaerae bacterium]|nr:methyltransferase domain-containing protein [Phycisphaerae bacterium]